MRSFQFLWHLRNQHSHVLFSMALAILHSLIVLSLRLFHYQLFNAGNKLRHQNMFFLSIKIATYSLSQMRGQQASGTFFVSASPDPPSVLSPQSPTFPTPSSKVKLLFGPILWIENLVFQLINKQIMVDSLFLFEFKYFQPRGPAQGSSPKCSET